MANCLMARTSSYQQLFSHAATQRAILMPECQILLEIFHAPKEQQQGAFSVRIAYGEESQPHRFPSTTI